jgi:Flp pilus assembly protein TadG
MQIREFVRNTRGNIAIAMAFASIPLLGVAGVAVDFANKMRIEAKLQAAVDAGTLAGASLRGATEQDIRKVIRRYAKQNDVAKYLDDDSRLTINLRNDGTINVRATGKVDTTLTRVLGFESMDVEASAQAKRGDGGAEVALVLDNTASMNTNDRIGSLRNAASQFTTELLRANQPSNPDLVKISIVPYAQYVNVGLDKRGQSWLHVEPDLNVTWTDCSIPGSNRLEASTIAGDTGMVEVWDYYTDLAQCVQRTYVRQWYGCVGSREYPYNIEDRRPDIRFIGVRHTYCPTPITPLTSQSGTLQSAISSLSTNIYQDANTYIPSGLSWGWRTLSSDVPYSEGVSSQEAANRGIKKHLVLMTDGVNTAAKQLMPNVSSLIEGTSNRQSTDQEWLARNDRFGPEAQDDADQITSELCTNIKAAGITIHTVAFEVSESSTRDLLRDCASSPANYYNADDAASLANAFDSIAGNIQAVHLSK